MFGFNYRPYRPGFWLTGDGTPGFNVGNNDLPPLSTEPAGADLPEGREFVIQAPPLADLPPFLIYPPLDLNGFNVDDDGAPLQSNTPTVPDVLLPEPKPAVQLAPIPALPEIRVDPRPGIPGFNVGPNDGVPGFNVGEDRFEQPQATRSVPPTREPSSREQEPGRLDPIPFPKSSADVVATPQWPPISIDQFTRPRIAVDPSVGAKLGVAGASSSMQGAMRSRSSAAGAPLSTSSVPFGPAANLPVAGRTNVTEVLARRATPQVPAGIRTGMAPMTTKLSVEQMQLAPQPYQSLTSLTEAPRAPERTQDKRLFSTRQSMRPSLEKEQVLSTPSTVGPSMGQRLAQSSITALVPGAHYQNLAREQFEAKNYLGAAAYQAAAFADAILGVATFGLSTRANAAARAMAAKGRNVFLRSFDSWEELRRYLGPPPPGKHWHHIVEKNQATKFGKRRVNSVDNVVAITSEEHHKLSGFYGSKRPFSNDKKVREWLQKKSFEKQYEFGMKYLKKYLEY